MPLHTNVFFVLCYYYSQQSCHHQQGHHPDVLVAAGRLPAGAPVHGAAGTPVLQGPSSACLTPVPQGTGLLGWVHGFRAWLQRRPEDDGHPHAGVGHHRRHPGVRGAGLGHRRQRQRDRGGHAVWRLAVDSHAGRQIL